MLMNKPVNRYKNSFLTLTDGEGREGGGGGGSLSKEEIRKEKLAKKRNWLMSREFEFVIGTRTHW